MCIRDSPVPAEKQDLAYLPDRFETGERVQTPRGSFQVDVYKRQDDGYSGTSFDRPGIKQILDDAKSGIAFDGTDDLIYYEDFSIDGDAVDEELSLIHICISESVPGTGRQNLPHQVQPSGKSLLSH